LPLAFPPDILECDCDAASSPECLLGTSAGVLGAGRFEQRRSAGAGVAMFRLRIEKFLLFFFFSHFVGTEASAKTASMQEMGEQTRNAYNCMWEGKKRTKHP
jgi:hypothetical protein